MCRAMNKNVDNEDSKLFAVQPRHGHASASQLWLCPQLGKGGVPPPVASLLRFRSLAFASHGAPP
jgi:hypothetical protein